MTYGNFKDLAKRTASDKVLGDMMDHKEVLLLFFIIFLIKKNKVSGIKN